MTSVGASGVGQREACPDADAIEASEPRFSWRRQARLSGVTIFASVGVSYLVLAQFVIWLNDPVHLGAGFWPAAGLTTAALLLLPVRRWGWVVAAVVVAESGGDLLRGYPAAAAFWWTVGNCLGPLVGAALVRRFADRHGQLVSLRSFLGFVTFGVLVGPLVGASVGAIGSVAILGNPVGQVWPKYVVGDALGVLVTAPMLLVWHADHARRHRAESFALTALLAVAPMVAFRGSDGSWDLIIPLLMTPLLTWAALRFGVRGAAWSIAWIAQAANWATASGYGPFAFAGGVDGHAVTLLQLFLGITAASALLVAVLVADLADRDDVERTLWHQANHDALTGLPSRTLLSLRLEEAIARRDVHDARNVVLVACDLDDFKVINDSLGHLAGDEVLTEVARRLTASVRRGDVVARIGGDEFVLLLEDADEESVRTLTDRLRTATSEPITLSTGHQVEVGVSVGIAAATPHHDGPGLLRDADATLYHAKAQGRGHVARFDRRLRLEVLERLTVPRELRTGMSRDELFCLYQPEVELASGRLFGFESLVRWQHPERGLVTPDRFVPLAETFGLVGELFDHVLENTLTAQQLWFGELGFRPAISVNLSARQLGDTTLPDTVATALARTGTPAELLWLEVTEAALAGAGSSATLAALHDLGINLAIDDFGTGWSSLARLSDFPWDLLKIDRSFISKLTRGSQAEHVVHATVVMAHALQMRTVAEGVETHEQLDILTDMGCDIAQGYLFARPLAVEDAIADVASDGRWTGAGGSGDGYRPAALTGL